MSEPSHIVFVGLTLSSSWGNGHATTYRALLKGLAPRVGRVTFLERDVPWYAENRDFVAADYCDLVLYHDVREFDRRFGQCIADADAVVVGSYVPDGVAILDRVLGTATGVVAFYDIDTPVTLARLAEGGAEYLLPRQVPEVDVYFSFAGGPAIDRLHERYGARRALPLNCMVDPELYAPTGEAVQWDLGYLGTYSPDRQDALDRLLLEPARRLPDRRFVVAGPQYPKGIAWPRNVDRMDHVPPADHASFYSRLRFALNVTRADMRAIGWAPSVRMFEAAACATPIISDSWEGIDSYFPPGGAMLVVDDTEDVVSALDNVDAAAAAGMGCTARRVAIERHTGDARAAVLIDALAAARQPGRANGGNGQARPGRNGRQSKVAKSAQRLPSGIRARRVAPSRVALVAGGAGFLGSHLCDRLIAEGCRVYCVDSFRTGRWANLAHLDREPRFVMIEHDVRDPLPKIGEIAEIYNLACPASPPHYQRDPVHTMTTSIVGTLSLLELAARLRARFIMASTSEIYGDPEVHPQPESYRGSVNPLGPRACYDEGKRAAESLCYDFVRAQRADVRVARIFNTYGPRMAPDDGRIVSNFVVQALSRRPLTVYGTGEQTRSFCYVSDLIEGLRALGRIPQAPASPVNLGNPAEFTVRELADLVCQLTGWNGPIVHEPLPLDDPRRRQPDISLAREALGWQPSVRLKDGLAQTIAWFRANGAGSPARSPGGKRTVTRNLPTAAAPLPAPMTRG